MEGIKNWVEYYNVKATRSDDPLEISDMHLGDSVANQLFLKSEEDRMRSFLQPEKVPKGHRHLLDLGCSAGTCTSLLEKYFDSVTGVDLAGNTIAVAQKRLPNCKFIVDDITTLSKLPADITYSHIISYGVLHYISREIVVDFFKTLARITKPGCRVVICRVPNQTYYEAYQEFRQKRALSRQLIVKDQLQWNWFSEEFLRSQVEANFEFIPFLPLLQLEFPLSAFFDFVLIRK